MINLIIELVLLICVVLSVYFKADIRIVIQVCTFYLAAVIRSTIMMMWRHNEKEDLC